MAHIGVALLGVGQVSYRGQMISAQQALNEEGLSPVSWAPKTVCAWSTARRA
jgi:histidine ammonia-lyase